MLGPGLVAGKLGGPIWGTGAYSRAMLPKLPNRPAADEVVPALPVSSAIILDGHESEAVLGHSIQVLAIGD